MRRMMRGASHPELAKTDRGGRPPAPRRCAHNRRMQPATAPAVRLSRGDSALTGHSMRRFHGDAVRVAVPRPEVQLAVRFGPSVPGGVDLHVLGPQKSVRRKFIGGQHRTHLAGCRLGWSDRIFGVPASELAGRIVALADLWGDGQAGELRAQLAEAGEVRDVARILERAVAGRVGRSTRLHPHRTTAMQAADLMLASNVGQAAARLGVSERHLRRVFHDVVGMSPKMFSRLARFGQALRAARESAEVSWAGIAAACGYCDQAHLIDEFHAIAGATPRSLLLELCQDDSGATP